MPKVSQKLFFLKKQMAFLQFAENFENQMCLLREEALFEAESWVINKKIGDLVFQKNEGLSLEHKYQDAQRSLKATILNIYAPKKGQGSIYRIKVEAIYKLKHDKKKHAFSSYITIWLR